MNQFLVTRFGAVSLMFALGVAPIADRAIAATPSEVGGQVIASPSHELVAVRIEGEIAWYAAETIGLEGKGWADTDTLFDRLPGRAKEIVRPPVWSLSQHSAGLCLHFVTDSRTIQADWKLRSPDLAMPHMPATGVSGVDLYVRYHDGWRWLANGKPTAQENRVTLTSLLPPGEREYLLYLPLYNGVTSLEVGVSTDASIHPAAFGESRRPIVFWGTSITQGGCASRPGMVHTAILGRRLERPVVNLGFSGNGMMEPELASLIAEIDAAAFVIDCLPNMTAPLIRERTRPLVEILRQRHSDVPILLVEDRTYSDSFLIESRRSRNEASRQALREEYNAMQRAGIPGLHYLEGQSLLSAEGDDTVDGSHPTDLGFTRQADAFETVLRPLLKPLSD